MSVVTPCPACGEEPLGSPNFCPGCGASLQEPGPTGEAKLSGLHVGGFVLGEPIRTGTVGEIYLATHESLGKQVVVKLIHPQLLGDPNTSRRFRREALAASRLNHPNVIHVLDFGQLQNGRLYLAMEYVEGIDLAELQHRDSPLEPARIVSLLRQICFALDEAHGHGVLHRDLKPENIMVGDRPNMRDHVKVVDFGIAKVTDASQSLASIQSIGGLFCGTPEYMSPEQARGGDLDGRSDLYSLGVILYQLLVGEVPFQDSTPLGVITRHLSETPAAPVDRRPEAHPELSALALRLLSKEPEQRFASAMEVVTELDYIKSLVDGGSSPHSTTEREAATLSDIPVYDTNHETKPQPVPDLSDNVTQPELVQDSQDTQRVTDQDLPMASSESEEAASTDGDTSPGDDLAVATQDVPVVSYPTTTPINRVGLEQGELTRTWVTGLLMAVAIFLVGWLVFRIWPNPVPQVEAVEQSIKETRP